MEKTTGADGKERRQPEKKEAKTAVAKALERVSKAREVEKEEKPAEDPPKETELATELNSYLNVVWQLCRTESNWPPLNLGRQKRRDQAMKKLRSVTLELLELAKPAPPRGRPPKGRTS